MKQVSDQEFARNLRVRALRMVHKAKASHIGSCLSIGEIVAVLFNGFLRLDSKQPNWPERDRFILSKGHAAAIYYAALSERGFFPASWIERYCENAAKLAGHVTMGVPGVEFSAGALGHGLPVSLGMAKAAKHDGASHRVVVLMSDGECDEGSVWEGALLAAQYELDNLTVIVDYNKIQSFGRVSDVADLHPFAQKWEAFRWGVQEVDGNDCQAVKAALSEAPFTPGKPSVIIAHTIKGKGVSFMEDNILWHYKSPNDVELANALAELEVN